LDLFSFDI
jgi:hypothetical protein